MIDLTKSIEFFEPQNEEIHIIGCGSVGSTLAEHLVRCGETDITLWDFDDVESHNIHNQMFYAKQIGMPKVEALKEILLAINPEAKVHLKPKGWNGEMLSGYVFLAVDSMEVRKAICEKHKNNLQVKAIFDVRTGLTDAQSFAADWKSKEQREGLLATMNFSSEEAQLETPVSACGATLGVMTTVRMICALCVNNYIRYCKGEGNWKYILMDGFTGFVDAV